MRPLRFTRYEDDLTTPILCEESSAVFRPPVETEWSPAVFVRRGRRCSVDVEGFDMIVVEAPAEIADEVSGMFAPVTHFVVRDARRERVQVVLPLAEYTPAFEAYEFGVAVLGSLGTLGAACRVLRPSSLIPRSTESDVTVTARHPPLLLDGRALVRRYAPDAELPETAHAASVVESVSYFVNRTLESAGPVAARALLLATAHDCGRYIERGELHHGGATGRLNDAACCLNEIFTRGTRKRDVRSALRMGAREERARAERTTSRAR